MKEILMRKLLSCLLIAIWPCMIAIHSPVQAADLLKMGKVRFNIQQEKHDVVVHFKEAAIGQFGVPSGSEVNAFIGVTADFGATIPVFLLFKEVMPIDQAEKYALHQGKNHGKAQCELVQKGNSPDMPAVPLAVLAQNCTILAVEY